MSFREACFHLYSLAGMSGIVAGVTRKNRGDEAGERKKWTGKNRRVIELLKKESNG